MIVDIKRYPIEDRSTSSSIGYKNYKEMILDFNYSIYYNQDRIVTIIKNTCSPVIYITSFCIRY